MSIYDSEDLPESALSVRVFSGNWYIYSKPDNKGHSKIAEEGMEIPDLSEYESGVMSVRILINDQFCYTERGEKYVGSRDYTASGKSCQAWNSTHPHVHTDNLAERHNHCRWVPRY